MKRSLCVLLLSPLLPLIACSGEVLTVAQDTTAVSRADGGGGPGEGGIADGGPVGSDSGCGDQTFMMCKCGAPVCGSAGWSCPTCGPDAGDADACVAAPKLGESCSPGQTPCDYVDPCCTETLTCQTGTWKNAGIACLWCPSFACGSKTCAGGEVCLARQAGVDGGSTSYECAPMPAACSRNWSCGCVTKNLPANCTPSPSTPCGEQGTHVTVTCMGM